MEFDCCWIQTHTITRSLVRLQLPFQHFMLTSKGYYKFNDQTALDPSKLRSVRLRCVVGRFEAIDCELTAFVTRIWCTKIGFAIADQKEGDFELRIQWIKAVAQLDQPVTPRSDDDDDDDRYVLM